MTQVQKIVVLLALSSLCWAIASYLSCRRTTRRNQRAVRDTNKTSQKPDLEDVDLSPITPSNEDWRTRPQIAYRPWQNGPYHVTMGLKNVTMSEWIDIDETYLQKYELKKSLYENHRDEVLQVLPGCEEGLQEALHLLKDVLVRKFPKMFRLRDKDVIENLVTGDVWDLHRDASTWKTYHPLEIMGLLATEDFFLLQTDSQTGVSTLMAAGSCFPAGFKIEERVGHSLWGIHAGRVPQYETKLAKSMDRFFQKLRVDSPIQRFNYAIDDSDELFHRHSHHNLTADDEASSKKLSVEDLHLRVERQVLQRLPRTRDILFSIRTYVTPIVEVTQDEEVSRALRTSVNSYSDDVAKYKNKPLWNDIFQEHIQERWGSDAS